MQAINSNDYVIRLNIDDSTTSSSLFASSSSDQGKKQKLFHLNCFMCAECKKQIAPGHPYGILNEIIYCTQHYYSKKMIQTNKEDSKLKGRLFFFFLIKLIEHHFKIKNKNK